MRLFLKRPCIAGGCSWTKMIVYVQISWRELIFVIYLAYLEANLNDSFFGDLGIDFVNPSVNTVLVCGHFWPFRADNALQTFTSNALHAHVCCF